MMGACVDKADGSLKVWACDVSRSVGLGGKPKVQYKLRPLRFQCSSSAGATDLARQIRLRSCWWGRTSPQQVAIIYNPASGKSR
jgi:hypothetical protein